MKKILFLLCVMTLLEIDCWAQFTTEKSIDSTQTDQVEEQKMQILVTDHKTKRAMEADVIIKGLNPRKTIIFKDLTDTTVVLKKYRIYTVSVVKPGFMYFSHKFWPDESSMHLERIELKPLSVGLKTAVDITFLGDETEIYHKSFPALEELTIFLEQNPSVKIKIIGHANGPAGPEQKPERYYRQATEKRAEAVRDYLIQHGVMEERLTTEGMGNKAMLYPDPQAEWQMEINRRIEIEVTHL
jgi:outer membrane protein OmpA-like peptidoglycan-associated protein